MPRPVSANLLALAASVADGGEAVRRTLVGLVSEAAPFDAGEIVTAPERFPLGALAEGESLATADLLAGLGSVGAPLRFDDWPDMDGFPETRARLRALGLRSLLAFPLGERETALVLARRQGWGFAGVPVLDIVPVARMAGLALARARELRSLGRQVEALEAGLSAGGSDVEALRREVMSCHREREAAQQEAELLRSRLEAGERGWREAEARLQEQGSRAVAELEAARLRVRDLEAELLAARSAREEKPKPARRARREGSQR